MARRVPITALVTNATLVKAKRRARQEGTTLSKLVEKVVLEYLNRVDPTMGDAPQKGESYGTEESEAGSDDRDG